MKVLIGNKLINLKDCVGYYCSEDKPFCIIFNELFVTTRYLIYERFEKTSIVMICFYGDKKSMNDVSDFTYYNIPYIDINKYIKQKKMLVDEGKDNRLCWCVSPTCSYWSHNYFRFDVNM